MLKQLTPILIVDEIEPCLPFWTGRLGFTLVASVPDDGGKIVFAMLAGEGVQVMYQTSASLDKDLPALANQSWRTILYIDVEKLDDVLPKLEGAEVVTPVRKTFYGATEIFVREPGGSIVGFAEHSS